MLFMQLVTIVAMFLATYLVYQAFGPRRTSLVYTAEEKATWDAMMRRAMGSWFASTSIVGTLMSLATVYIFFIGTSKVFGGWTFLAVGTLLLGGFVTNFATKRICRAPHVKALLESHEQVGGVVASLFWQDEPKARRTAQLVRWISLVNIAGIIWLEFAVFVDIATRLMRLASLEHKLLLMFSVAFGILYFTLKYGLRGFVFADVFQSPTIALGSIVLLVVTVLFAFRHGITLDATSFTPIVPPWTAALFAAHVLMLNSVIVLVTEPHWLRVWIYREKETTLQVPSLGITALISSLLIVVGLLAFAISGGKIGEAAVEGLLTSVSQTYPVAYIAFWAAAVGALFSTADIQVYSFLLVRDYDARTGRLVQTSLAGVRPVLHAFVAAAAFATLYGVVRRFDLPLEKIIFVVIPLALNLLPAFVRATWGKQQRPSLILWACGLYAVCAAIGFLQPEASFAWTLASVLAPIGMSIMARVIR